MSALVQNPPITLCELTGIIKNIKIDKGGNMLTIISAASQREYKVFCSYFCPARRGDVTTGYCMQKDNGQYFFIQEPLVEPASSKEAVQSMFLIALKGTSFNRWMSDALYDFFKGEALRRIDELSSKKSDDPVLRNRDMLPSATMEMISDYAYRFRTDESTSEPLEHIGLSKIQAQKLLRWWFRAHSLRRLYLLGLTKREIRESCERGWDTNTLYYQLIENPYIVEKIPIEKAEAIVRRYRLSFGQNMIECAHLVRFVDEQTDNRGWACYPLYGLMKKFPRFLELQPILKEKFKCTIRYNFFYLRHHAETEDTLTYFLQSRSLPETHCSDATKQNLVEEQIHAVEMALNNTVSIITGKGGCGKTTVISALADELDLRNEGYMISAFTGKAVARIKEVVKRKKMVQTLDMILNRGLPTDKKIRNLIVDEASMVPNELIARVLTKLISNEETFRIVLVGDPNQLQPIAWGDLFNQLFLASTLPTTYLLMDHRRTGCSTLRSNIEQFDTSIPDEIDFQWGNDCQFMEGGVPEVESIARVIYSHGIKHTQITILNPFNKYLEDLNKRCQDIFIDKTAPSLVDSFGKQWKIGARIMMTVNRYDVGIMNGEEGIITEIHSEKAQIVVRFRYGDDVPIPTFVLEMFNDLADVEDLEEPLSTKLLVLSWAITIHKSQGSEWQHVILYLPPNHAQSSFLNRKLLYTGISRPQDALYTVATSTYAFLSIIGVDPPMRYDNLHKRLKGEEYFDYWVDPTTERRRQIVEEF